jgi:hypothetical protein
VIGKQQRPEMRTFFSLHRCGRTRRRQYSQFRRRFARFQQRERSIVAWRSSRIAALFERAAFRALLVRTNSPT